MHRKHHSFFWIAPVLACSVVALVRPAIGQMPRKAPSMVTDQTIAAIDKGLKYLASRQGSDGAFRDRGSMGTYPLSMTALSGLALISSGSTPTEGR